LRFSRTFLHRDPHGERTEIAHGDAFSSFTALFFDKGRAIEMLTG
jgi:hypothetical protein